MRIRNQEPIQGVSEKMFVSVQRPKAHQVLKQLWGQLQGQFSNFHAQMKADILRI